MPLNNSQIQVQTESLRLHTSPQQIMMAKLLELSVEELEQRVKNEIMDNVALEEWRDAGEESSMAENADNADETDENDSGYDGDDGAFDDEDVNRQIDVYGDPDDLPVYNVQTGGREDRDTPIGDTKSFIDDLMAQMVDYDLTPNLRVLLEYLIGSLDNRGFIVSTVSKITDEVAFTLDPDVEEADVVEAMKILRQFDPAGIGATDTRDCLLLQIDRKLHDADNPLSETKERMLLLEREILDKHYEPFINGNKERLKSLLGINDVQLSLLLEDIRKLNVNPGLSLAESSSDRSQVQIPDFIAETDPEGNVTFGLNSGDVPRVCVSREYLEQLKRYQAKKGNISRSEKEAMQYTRQTIEDAQQFISAIKQRRHTMRVIMKAIVELQHEFFLSKDTEDLNRLVLSDVAKRAGLDISTVSRVCKTKCVLLDGRIYPLSMFFKLTRNNAEGEEIDGAKVQQMLRAIVDAENKKHPYTDEQIMNILKTKGVSIARRTVAKYRTEMGIPTVKLRQA